VSSQDSRGGAATSLRDRRVGRVIDREIAPIWHDRFARMLIRNLPSNLPNADVTALDIHCGVGRTTAELLSRLGASARVMALEPDDILLELARTRMRPEWKNRVYLKAGNFDDVTAMSDDSYNLVVANLVLGETGDVASALGEMIRVNRIGGRVLATLPLGGSWNEVEDIFSEVLRDAGLHAANRRLDRLRELRPTGPNLAQLVRQLGVAEDDFVIEQERFHMLFPSGREFLFAPVVEHGPLRLWKAVIGKDGTPQELFWRLKEAIDTYYTGHVLAVNVLAGLINIHVAKGTESPGPRLAARYWRHYPTLDALWGGLAAGYVRISEPAVPFTDADLDFDLEIDDLGGTGRTGAQKAITTSVQIVTDDMADEPDLPSDRPSKQPEAKPPVTTKPEPSGPKTPSKPSAPSKTADDFDAAFAEYNPPEEPAPAPVTPATATTVEPEPAKQLEPEEPAPAKQEDPTPAKPEDPAPRRGELPTFRKPASESGKFRPPTQTEPNVASGESSGTSVADLKFRPPDSGSAFRRPSGEGSGARPLSETSGLRPPGEASGLMKPVEPSGFMRPLTRSADPGTATGSFKVFAPPKPREATKEPGSPSAARIRRNSQPLGMSDVPRSLAVDMDADPATERAFDQLMNDPSDRSPTRDEPKQPIDTRPAKSLMAELEAEIPKDLDEPSLVLSAEAKPAESLEPESTREPVPEPEPKPSSLASRMAALEAAISPSRPEPDPADEEELDELDEVDDVDEAPVAARPAKPGPPPPRPAKAPPPPPSGAFKPRPLMPIVPPTKKK
jgi:SAM-dependent methyltransferase